jgi:3-hydroxy-9,10-secoandrosta-1,3,5(10)-triene-9,17-dione monooxygenase
MATQAAFDPVEDRPAEETLIARARALLPAIAARREEADSRRDLPPETVAELRAAGLFRAFQPRGWGGLELDPRVVLDIQNIFAEVCVSTAWIYGVLSVQAFLLARFDRQAQADVWGGDPMALVSSSFQPVGTVTPVDGGFRIAGRFPFSSGSSHCDWALVGGVVPPVPGRDKPEMRLFLIPRADYAIHDTWRVIGLKATGSNDLVIEDAFVPGYRTYAPDSGLLPLPASSGLSPLYRLPWLHVFASAVSNLGVGAARGALAAFAEATKSRRSGVTGVAASDNPLFHSVIARTRAEADAADVIAKRNFGHYVDHVARDAPVSLSDALVYRAQLTSSMRKMALLVDEMMLLLGGRGIHVDAPISRFWLDLSAARAHVGNDPSVTFSQLAGETIAGR